MGDVEVIFQDRLAQDVEYRQFMAGLLDEGYAVITVFHDGGHPHSTEPTGMIVLYKSDTDKGNGDER